MNLVQERPARAPYRCLRCHSKLAFQTDGDLVCSACEAIYPSIDGVKILVSDPRRFLQSFMRNLSESRKEITERRAKLTSVPGELYSQEALSLARSGCDGQLANLALVEQVMTPVKERLSDQPRQKSLFDDFHLDESAWTSLFMLPYFYRDWNQLEEARLLTDLFTGAVKEHCRDDWETAAVLGCGAGGLVYDLAELFPVVFGLDLAVDSLLIAKRLLNGARFELHFNLPSHEIPISQSAVVLKGPAQRRDGIELVAANVNNLPFDSASLSCVVSSYLLDIAPSPQRVLSEIHRVLAPTGVWINFSIFTPKSNALGVGSFDQLNNLDWPSFLQQFGFTLLGSSMRRFKNIDLSAISPWAGTSVQTPVFSVAKKNSSQGREQVDYFAEYFAKKADAVWLMAPKISEYAALVQERVFTDRGVEERQRIAVYRTNNSRPITKENAVVAEWLLRKIDGALTIREIFDLLRKEYGDVVEADEFLRFFSDLQKSQLIGVE